MSWHGTIGTLELARMLFIYSTGWVRPIISKAPGAQYPIPLPLLVHDETLY